METIKRTVKVIIEKEIEVELMPSMFGGMTPEEYLAEFRKGLWHVDSFDDIAKYAARMTALYDEGEYEGLGLLADRESTYPRVPDVKFKVIDDFTEATIVT